jgi:hypothetical protein
MSPYFDQMTHGPGAMRFILQPIVAIALGLVHGLRGRRAGLRGIAVPLVIALAASLIFQFVIRSEVHVVNAVGYAIGFVVVPYFAARQLTAYLHGRRRAA